jgi:hypothetical protein
MENIVLTDGYVYVVTMYRFANRDEYSYVIYVSDNLKMAIQAEEKECKYRGGKFDGEIVKIKLNDSDRKRTVVPGKKIYN